VSEISHLSDRRPVRADIEGTLAASSLFSDLDHAELAEVARLAEPFGLPAGDLLFRQGDRAEQLYVLEAGRLEIVARLPGDREMLLSQVGAGDVLGELALVAGGTRTASARAVEPTRGLLISRDAFGRLRTILRPTGAAVMRRLSRVVYARLRALRLACRGDPPGRGGRRAGWRPRPAAR
jgi:CRP/FNR family cyclic AMP-dependent transcriptional regulator